MNSTSRVFYLNGRQLLYLRRTYGYNNQNVEKRLTEIPQGKDFAAGVKPFDIVKITSENNGKTYSYKNRLTFQSIDAVQNSTGAYTVTTPSKKGKLNVGYIKDDKAIPWTRHKATKRLMNKLANMIKNEI